MSHYILDRSYRIEEQRGVEAYHAVAQGSEPGVCRLPGKLGGTLLGVTVHTQSNFGCHVVVRKAGIARCIAEGPIPLGSPVRVTEDGRVAAIDWKTFAADGRLWPASMFGVREKGSKPYMVAIECLGFAETEATREGDVLEVYLQFHQRVV